MSPTTVPLGELIETAPIERAGNQDLPVLSMTRAQGLVRQEDVFKKVVASRDLTKYKVVNPGQLVVGIHIDEGALGFSGPGHHGIVSPAYAIWDLQNPSVVDPSYLDKFLRSPRAIAHFIANYRKTADRRGKLTKEQFLSLQTPLPPIEEQRRIAAILDAADALRAKRRQAFAKLDTLTQAIFIDIFGDPLRTSRDNLTTMGQLVEFVGGGTPSKSEARFFTGEICWATSKDMKSDVLLDTQDHITQEAITKSSTKLVQPGSVLVVVKSKILARTLPVAIAGVPTCFGQDLKALVPGPNSNSAFVAGALRASAPWLLSRTRGVNTEGLTLDELRRTPVAVASESALTKFGQIAASIADERAAQDQAAESSDTFFASLQQRAFRGEL